MGNIPFNKPALVGNELNYISQALENRHVSGGGSFTRSCQRHLEAAIGAPKVLLTTSCTDALEMSAGLLDLSPGDEVIVPSFTFVSTANAFALHGATPVFADIRRDTLNLDESQVESLISPRTRAIVPVHYAGVACEMDSIREIADKYHIRVIEDNAHGLFADFKGRPLGSLGDLAALSFHETKNISCGEGGALIINDSSLIERAEILWEKGTNRSMFMRGEVDKYTWVDKGSSYLPSDMNAAFLLGQLEQKGAIQDRRRAIWERYVNGLADWAETHDVGLPFVPSHCDQAYHMFYLIMPTESHRNQLIDHLRRHDILGVFHYVPLHISPMGKALGGERYSCPNTEWVSSRLIRLPFYFDLTERDQERVSDCVRSAFAAAGARAAVG